MMINFRHISSAALGLICFTILASANATEVGDNAQPSHLNAAGQDGYGEFMAAPPHRAFAIAPGGAWAWVSGSTTADIAEAEALAACRKHTKQTCQLYATDEQVIFDEATWNAAWDLHFDKIQVSKARFGTGRGDRFPDLALTTPNGEVVTLSQLEGKVVFLHFWGSWCPPCQSEFEDLQELYTALEKDDRIAFVFVQGRESISKSRRWAKKRGFTMPLHDSGHQGRGDKSFHLGDGTTLSDRRLTSVYPSTYVLDANGIITFHQAGPGEQWTQYENLLRHLSAKVAK